MAALVERQIPIEVIGSGTKRSIGRPISTPLALTTTGMRGISLYEPSELVSRRRALAHPSRSSRSSSPRAARCCRFEPIDLAPAVGSDAGVQTIGAVFAGNLSGARRISLGAARDFLLGIRGVNGRAEQFKSGGRVMKNVTGYDVARGLAGSWGTLAVLSEVTFKVLPLPDDVATLVYPGLTDDLGVELLSTALGLPFEVSGTVHLTEGLPRRLKHPRLKSETRPLTAIRIENFTRSYQLPKGAPQGRAHGLWHAHRARPRRLAAILGRVAQALRFPVWSDAPLADIHNAEAGTEARHLHQASHAGGRAL